MRDLPHATGRISRACSSCPGGPEWYRLPCTRRNHLGRQRRQCCSRSRFPKRRSFRCRMCRPQRTTFHIRSLPSGSPAIPELGILRFRREIGEFVMLVTSSHAHFEIAGPFGGKVVLRVAASRVCTTRTITPPYEPIISMASGNCLAGKSVSYAMHT